jgi:hypothetical protein
MHKQQALWQAIICLAFRGKRAFLCLFRISQPPLLMLEGEGVGIYPAAALLTHDCCPNVCHAALAIILHNICFDHTNLPSPILFISLSLGVPTAPPFMRAPRCPSRQVQQRLK